MRSVISMVPDARVGALLAPAMNLVKKSVLSVLSADCFVSKQDLFASTIGRSQSMIAFKTLRAPLRTS
jgi:hypothetical protein